VTGRRLVIAALALLVLTISVPAEAAFPGAAGRIAFQGDVTGNREIYTVWPDGSGLRNLTRSPADDTFPDWSPDGSTIVFVSDRTGDQEIYSMRPDGSGLRRLTRSPGSDLSPSWSPDMQRIVFASGRNDPDSPECFFCDFDLFTMKPDGSDVRLLSSLRGEELGPEWSPTGEWIAFWGGPGGPNGCSAVYVIRPDGSDLTRLTPMGLEAAEPDWSPDGSRIAFSHNACEGLSDIFVMQSDGSGTTRLTAGFGNNIGPAWSPEGDRIVFHHGRNDNTLFVSDDLWLMRPDGSAKTRLTHTADAAEARADWQSR
jgi:TolB protein